MATQARATTSVQRRRGSYEAGRVRRDLILERAAERFAQQGFAATSAREIATACGLTPAGLSHHFPEKSDILLALIERREAEGDELQSKLPWREWLLELERRNRERDPLITRLFVVLSAEATDPSHPAHEWFQRRYEMQRNKYAELMRDRRGGRTVTSEDRVRAQIMIAAWDGLQLQATLDPNFLMRPAFESVLQLLTPTDAAPLASAPAPSTGKRTNNPPIKSRADSHRSKP